jgi:hypothetical protein
MEVTDKVIKLLMTRTKDELIEMRRIRKNELCLINTILKYHLQTQEAAKQFKSAQFFFEMLRKQHAENVEKSKREDPYLFSEDLEKDL